MLVEVDEKKYKRYFPADTNPFISEKFTELNNNKADRIFRLVENTEKPVIGLTVGLKDGILKSPFSAPFGGFHYKNEKVYVGEIESFLQQLKKFVIHMNLKGIDITMPPDIYHQTFNAKTIHSFLRTGFEMKTPEITNWIDLLNFKGEFSQKNSREYYRQALRNRLTFSSVTAIEEKKVVYNLICENRKKFGRPIYMSFDDIEKTGQLWPVDFFKVSAPDGELAASAIFYRCHPSICYAVFWGDNEKGRPLRAMDFLAFHLWSHYKNSGFSFIDLGISTEQGNPNEGLLRFKESHNATSSLRYSFFLFS
ncbi:MAG: hypothetical protein JXB00_08605 [Bacteroidales bacterium]|nr:hypothetical protein [Bacteroidales bacterium]